MKFKKILFIMENTNEDLEASEKLVEKITDQDVQLIVLNIIDVIKIRHLKSATNKSETEIFMEEEEESWKYLYLVEDIAKNHFVHTVLEQEEGHFTSVVSEQVKKFNADLVALRKNSSSRSGIKIIEKRLSKLIENVDCPLLIL